MTNNNTIDKSYLPQEEISEGQKGDLFNYIIGIADNSLILGQRLGELCGHGPSLETDIAGTNISLDLFGQVRSYFQYAAQVVGDDKATEDTLAFLRINTDFGYTIARQFFFDAFHLLFLKELQNSNDATLAAIATKSTKEVSYHWRFSSDWIRRLGDGTQESHERIQEAINDLWMYTDELFHQTDADKAMIEIGVGVDTIALRETYYKMISDVLEESTITIPESKYWHKGGKQGIHSEHMGYILSDMQYMQRTYPNMEW